MRALAGVMIWIWIWDGMGWDGMAWGRGSGDGVVRAQEEERA